MPIVFYFDFVSPYAYLAYRELRARKIDVEAVPVVFTALLDVGKQLGPAEIPAKMAYVKRDCVRRAKKLGVPFMLPAVHPFRSIEALRLALVEVSGEDQGAVIDAIFRAGWERGEDIGDPDVLTGALDARGLQGKALLAKTQAPEVKEALKSTTATAIDQGVFGVPSFYVGGDMIWGSDRIDDVVAAAGVDKQTEERINAIFSQAPFVGWLGVEIASMSVDSVVTSLSVKPEHKQQDGFVHAGVISTLADHTAGATAGIHMPEGATPLTVEYKVNLLRPAKGPRLSCRGAVVRSGKNISVVESEVFDGTKLVAKAIVTLIAANVEALRG